MKRTPVKSSQTYPVPPVAGVVAIRLTIEIVHRPPFLQLSLIPAARLMDSAPL
jgi:hypothetical protein